MDTPTLYKEVSRDWGMVWEKSVQERHETTRWRGKNNYGIMEKTYGGSSTALKMLLKWDRFRKIKWRQAHKRNEDVECSVTIRRYLEPERASSVWSFRYSMCCFCGWICIIKICTLNQPCFMSWSNAMGSLSHLGFLSYIALGRFSSPLSALAFLFGFKWICCNQLHSKL